MTDFQQTPPYIPYIGLASGIAGRHLGSGQGPLVLQKELPSQQWKAMICPDTQITDKLELVSYLNRRLAEETFQTLQTHPSLIVIGGDHSCGIGTWSGVSEALYQRGQDLGLIWLDAHMDSHTPQTSPSGNMHGMPIAALLGHGPEQLTHILSTRPKIKPENLFLIGIRSYEEAEKSLLEKLNVRIYYIEEVQERGIEAILKEVLAHFSKQKIPYGISLDIDFFDPSKMPATGTPEPTDIDPDLFISSCSPLKDCPPVAFEFVEFNPPLDCEGKSLNYIRRILDAIEDILLHTDPFFSSLIRK